MSNVQDEARMPYWFTHEQLGALSRAVGDAADRYQNITLSSVSDEVGVAISRQKTSTIRQKLSTLFSSLTPMVALHLSQAECQTIIALNISDEINAMLNNSSQVRREL